MKKNLLAALLFASMIVKAQSGIMWSSSTDVAMPMFNNNHPRIALDANNNPLILWGDNSTNRAVFVRWNGSAFTAPVALNPSSIPVFAESWAGPDLAAHGDTVYAIYKQTPEDTNHIFMVHSFNGGMTFSLPMQVDVTGTGPSRFPSVGVDASGNPLVAFMRFDVNWTNPQYVVTKSNDFGNTFSPEVIASGFSSGHVCDCCPATIVSSPDYVTSIYRDNLNNIRNMWAGISTDGGATFNNGVQVDQSNWFNNSCPSSGPDGVIIGDSLYAVYMSEGTGNALTYFSSTSLVNLQAGTDIALTGNFTGLISQNYPRIAHADNAVGIVWRQTTNNSDQVNLFFTNDILNGLPAAYDTIATGVQLVNVDIAIAPGVVHMVWENETSGTVKYLKGTFTPISTGIQQIYNTTSGITTFPNPVSTNFRIINYQLKPEDKLELLNTFGETIILTPFQNNIDISSLPNGIYFLKIISGNQTFVSKIAKQ